MITAAKQLSNAIFMYLYLQYYRYRLRSSFDYMVKEALLHSQTQDKQ